MVYDYEAKDEITITLTKEQAYYLRMAAMRDANRLAASDRTPTTTKRVNIIDAATERLERIMYSTKVSS